MRPRDTTVHHTLSFSTNESLRRRFSIGHEKMPANVRWGLLLEVLDKLAEEVALNYVRRTHVEARVVTAAIDDIILRTPADIDRDLHLHARINYVGRTSLEVGIRVDHDGPNRPSLASCYFTMVCRTGTDDNATSVPVPPLTYVDELEKVRCASAIAGREAFRTRAAESSQRPSREEYGILTELHAAQDESSFRGLLAGDLVLSSWERMYPEQENVPRKIFGGHLIRRAFELAVTHAEDIAPDRPVAVCINRINFLQPVRIGDKLHFESRVVYTGNTSFCVEIDIRRVSQGNVTRWLSNTCTFTFVNVDENMGPRPVPKVYPTTYAEDARYLAAHRRRLRYGVLEGAAGLTYRSNGRISESLR